MMKNKVFGIGHLAIGLALWMAAGEAAAQYTNPPGRRVVMNEDPENGIKVAAGPGENLVLGEINNTVIVQGSSMEIGSIESINLNPGIGSVYLHNRPLRGVLDPTDDTHVGDRGYNNTLYATIAAASNAQATANAASNLATTAVQPAAATNIAQGVVDAAKIVVNVKDYGATGDGVTDDTDAIQSAVDSVESSGGSVYFPSGTYKITSEIIYTPTKGGGSFVGEGEYRTILNQTTATNGFVVRQTGDYDGLEFRNISIAGAGGGIGFSVEGASTALDRLSLSNVRTSGFETGISLLGVSQSLIRNCWSGLNVKGRFRVCGGIFHRTGSI